MCFESATVKHSSREGRGILNEKDILEEPVSSKETKMLCHIERFASFHIRSESICSDLLKESKRRMSQMSSSNHLRSSFGIIEQQQERIYVDHQRISDPQIHTIPKAF